MVARTTMGPAGAFGERHLQLAGGHVGQDLAARSSRSALLLSRSSRVRGWRSLGTTPRSSTGVPACAPTLSVCRIATRIWVPLGSGR